MREREHLKWNKNKQQGMKDTREKDSALDIEKA